MREIVSQTIELRYGEAGRLSTFSDESTEWEKLFTSSEEIEDKLSVIQDEDVNNSEEVVVPKKRTRKKAELTPDA